MGDKLLEAQALCSIGIAATIAGELEQGKRNYIIF